MLAQAVRVIIVSNNDLVLLHSALDKLRKGKALTAGESGVSAEDAIANLDLVVPIPPMIFDGKFYTQVLYVAGS